MKNKLFEKFVNEVLSEPPFQNKQNKNKQKKEKNEEHRNVMEK